jgi:hypothetical protein
MGGPRPPPGPAAPTSWLQTSRHAPAYMQNKNKSGAEHSAQRFGTLATTTNEELKVRAMYFRREHFAVSWA